MSEWKPMTAGELAALPDDECWQAYTKHEGKWSTKGAFLAALRIGRIQGREQAATMIEETMGHLASPLAPYNHGVADTIAITTKAIRSL